MERFSLMTLVTNYYEIKNGDLFLQAARIPSILVVMLDGCIPLAPAYPEGYLSLDVLTINHLLWSKHLRVHVQNSTTRRYFELTFSDTKTACSFVELVRKVTGADLIEQTRSPLEMDIISTSWKVDRLEGKAMESEPVSHCSLLKPMPHSPITSPMTTPPSNPLFRPATPSDATHQLQTPVETPEVSRTARTQAKFNVCSSSEEAIKELWKTGAWSDLTIVAGSDQFSVHKAIVCLRSSFFAAALSNDFAEALESRISVEEPPAVIQALLEYIYGQEPTICTPILLTSFATQLNAVRVKTVTLMVDVYVAADKYGVSTLQPLMVKAVCDRLPWISKAEMLTDLAHYVYETTPYRDDVVCEMREAIAAYMQEHLKAILLDAKGSSAMLENQSLMFDLLQRVAETKPTPDKLAASAKRGREEAWEEAVDERKKSLRPKKHIPGSYKLKLRDYS